MLHELAVQTVTVRGRAAYSCDRCGRVSLGSLVTLNLQQVADIAAATRNLSNQNMPVGWASYYRTKQVHDRFAVDEHRCPTCIDEVQP